MPKNIRLEQVIANTSVGVVITDPQQSDNPIVYANPAFTQITGYAAAEVMGKNCRFLHGVDTDPTTVHLLRQAIVDQQSITCTLLNYRQDGTCFWNEITVDPIFEAGEILYFVAILRDVTTQQQSIDLKLMEERLLYEALYDHLTGLPNRVLLMERLRHAVQIAQHNDNVMFATLFIDIDRFKMINDSLGHSVGDRLLIEIAKRLLSCLRPGDTLARLGGDEFVVLLEQIKNNQCVTQVADRIQHALTLPFDIEGHEVFTAASIGIALSTTGYARPEDLLRDADIAMYRAKAHGRARYEIFHPKMHTRAVALLQLETDLRRAIERQELQLHYQPIVSLRTRQAIGFEALIRWQHPTRGKVSPDEFIPIAEETGLIVPIGDWVLREACRQMQSWRQMFPDRQPLMINVNVSGKQFSPHLTEQVSKILRETGLDPRQLKIEITESLLMENAEYAVLTLTQLQELGIQLAMDDFGTGYSSLSYLHRFPIDTLKIDRSFISRLDVDGEQLTIVRTIIMLAWNLGMEVVAEGVETAKQLAQLHALRCEYAQGYFFSKPLDAQAVEQFIRAEQLTELQKTTEISS
ncbi:MAG: EAL domain-containing protein [Oscillatoriophycideae cyanobacterium NC_groundwater_1537_Pr4_S-0.65um_50_18]|nr:EAL domain-containing protein [Oscillatoriophycideae cyanobacterium NC_groundwater_1537_Pr4_S-0.65um_50_18]